MLPSLQLYNVPNFIHGANMPKHVSGNVTSEPVCLMAANMHPRKMPLTGHVALVHYFGLDHSTSSPVQLLRECTTFALVLVKSRAREKGGNNSLFPLQLSTFSSSQEATALIV